MQQLGVYQPSFDWTQWPQCVGLEACGLCFHGKHNGLPNDVALDVHAVHFPALAAGAAGNLAYEAGTLVAVAIPPDGKSHLPHPYVDGDVWR